jgi:hypothetical protein
MATGDDDSGSFLDDGPTHIDEAAPLPDPERETTTYKSLEFLAGRESGYKEGFNTAIAALRVELVRAGCTEAEIKSILSRVTSVTEKPTERR